MPGRPLVLMLVVLTPLLGACSLFGNGSGDSSPALITAPNPPIADVPVPAGFALVKSASTSQVIPASNLRIVDHLYSGPDDLLPVVRFYRDQLPAQGWTWVEQTQTKSEISLHFTKNSEDLLITVIPGNFHKNTHIRIRINPIAGPQPKG